MKQFQYKASDKGGNLSSGLIESVSSEAAARILQERKLLVIDIKEKREFGLKNLSLKGLTNKVTEREIATFTRLLATMLSTGLPLTESLTNLVTQTRNDYFREVLQTMLHDIQSGVSLSESMARHSQAFNELYVNLVKAGEATGKVDEALGKLADTLEANLDFKAKVKGALVYPAVIVVAMGGIAIFMVTTIIPKIASVYTEFGAELPLPTRILLGIASFFTHYTIIAVFLIGLVVYFYKILRKNPKSEFLLNNFYFKMPVLGPLQEEVTLAVVFRTLGTLLSSGVAILDALKIVSKTVENNYFRVALTTAATYVEKGVPLSLALRRNPQIPLMAAQLVAIGEETGTIDKSLERLAGFYQESAERKTKVLTTLLEPLMILVMGLGVGGLAVAVLLPMFNLVNVIK